MNKPNESNTTPEDTTPNKTEIDTTPKDNNPTRIRTSFIKQIILVINNKQPAQIIPVIDTTPPDQIIHVIDKTPPTQITPESKPKFIGLDEKDYDSPETLEEATASYRQRTYKNN